MRLVATEGQGFDLIVSVALLFAVETNGVLASLLFDPGKAVTGGENLFYFGAGEDFGISLPVLKIAGGLIVANTAWGMVTSHARITPEESHEAEDKADISLTPLAMPLMSGPGAIGVVMALAANVDSTASYLGMVIGIAAIALTVLLFFWLGGPLVRRLGPNAVGAINKIFGFLILAIAVQLVWDGVADFHS